MWTGRDTYWHLRLWGNRLLANSVLYLLHHAINFKSVLGVELLLGQPTWGNPLHLNGTRRHWQFTLFPGHRRQWPWGAWKLSLLDRVLLLKYQCPVNQGWVAAGLDRDATANQFLVSFYFENFLDKQSRFLIFEKSMFYNLEVFIFTLCYENLGRYSSGKWAVH